MKHHHVGPADEACEGCYDEAQADFRAIERRKTIWGVILIVVLALVFAAVISKSLSRGSAHHIGGENGKHPARAQD